MDPSSEKFPLPPIGLSLGSGAKRYRSALWILTQLLLRGGVHNVSSLSILPLKAGRICNGRVVTLVGLGFVSPFSGFTIPTRGSGSVRVCTTY